VAREKKSWRVPLAGLAGFTLGAATVLLIVWLYGGGTRPAPQHAEVPQALPPAALPTAPHTTPSRTPTPAPSTIAPLPAPVPPPADLAQRDLLVPVQGVPRTKLQDTFDDARS